MQKKLPRYITDTKTHHRRKLLSFISILFVMLGGNIYIEIRRQNNDFITERFRVELAAPNNMYSGCYHITRSNMKFKETVYVMENLMTALRNLAIARNSVVGPCFKVIILVLILIIYI